ncbi:acyltransferase family protein [Salmonella enterica]|uniref:acyltransferase family protein n=1 Tax=Salmonella enterica TaxID=28901 RepID=UPI003CF13719
MYLSEYLKRGNNNLDLARIVLALMVIVGHSAALHPRGGWVDPVSLFFPFTYSGALAVKGFFLVSGILVANSAMDKKDVQSFLLARFLRIFPGLLFVVIIIAFIIGPLFSILPINEYFGTLEPFKYVAGTITMRVHYFLPGVFIGNADGGSVNGSLWTIPYEVSMYCVMIGMFYLSGFNKKIITITSLIVILSPVFMASPVLGTASSAEIYPLQSCFFTGVLFAVYKDKLKINLLLPVLFALFYMSFRNDALMYISFYLSFSIFVVFVSGTELIKRIKIKKDISYGVYLWGFPVQQSISYMLNDISTIYHIILSIAITIPIAYFSFVFIESPTIALSKNIIRRQNEGKAHP